jgi:hypothetical protein
MRMRSEVSDAGGVKRWKVAAIVLAILLFVALAGDVLLYPRAMRPLVPPGSEPTVAETQQNAAVLLRTTVREQQRLTFPIVTRMGGRICVELRATGRVGNDYLECRDDKGKIVERMSSGHGSPL